VPASSGGSGSPVRAPRTEVLGFMDAAGGFSTGDARPIGQRVGELAAELGWGRLLAYLVDQGVPWDR